MTAPINVCTDDPGVIHTIRAMTAMAKMHAVSRFDRIGDSPRRVAVAARVGPTSTA